MIHAPAAFGEFDHSLWDLLLSKHVIVSEDGLSTAVDYTSLGSNREPLALYLDQASRISRTTFDAWETPEQLAFLINLYNAATVELILDNRKSANSLTSIRDIGTLFTSAWELKRVALFGERVTLDAIEHDMIRVGALQRASYPFCRKLRRCRLSCASRRSVYRRKAECTTRRRCAHVS